MGDTWKSARITRGPQSQLWILDKGPQSNPLSNLCPVSQEKEWLHIFGRLAKPGKGYEWVPCVVWMNLKQPPCGFCAIHAVYLLKIGQWLHSWSPEPAQLPAGLCPLPGLTALPSWPRVASCSGLIAHKTWHCMECTSGPYMEISCFLHLQTTVIHKMLSLFPDWHFLCSGRVGLTELQKTWNKQTKKKHFPSPYLVVTWNFNLLFYGPRR